MTLINELFNLKNKTALITGASSGLGRQMAKTLAQAGADIIGVARDKVRLSELASGIESMERQVKTFSVDFNDSNATQNFINAINDEQIKIDILINNAGIVKMTPVDGDHLDLWEKQINVNLKAVWQLTQGICKQMIANNIPGSIINISSINGAASPYAGASAYSATKAAVIQMSKVLSGELSKFNIRVNTIIPGLFYTELTGERIDNDPTIIQQIPLKFVAEPKDIDGLVLYLASNKASRYVTGAQFVIDGGISANCKGI